MITFIYPVATAYFLNPPLQVFLKHSCVQEKNNMMKDVFFFFSVINTFRSLVN